MHPHLEHAETGLDTLSRGVSAALWAERRIFALIWKRQTPGPNGTGGS